MGASIRILLVEDSEDDAALVVRRLRSGGLDVEFARVDTAPALDEALGQRTWDLVIADYAMPQLTAEAALARVRARGLDLPFIIVSGSIGEETAVRAMKAGAHDYIMKDNLARLVPAIERELREAAERRERRRAEDRIAFLAFHDALTGLPNRNRLEDAMAVALAGGRRVA
jgi:PleD family two-component response regulator